MRRFLILFPLCVWLGGDWEHLGSLTSSNQFEIGPLAEHSHFVICFESLETKTNVFQWTNYKETTIAREDVPEFMPYGRVKMSVHAVDRAGVETETNVFTFTLVKPAPRVRLTRRYPKMSPPLPAGFAQLSNMVAVKPLPGGMGSVYPAHRSAMK